MIKGRQTADGKWQMANGKRVSGKSDGVDRRFSLWYT